jgi:hypothetical protein
MVRGASLLTLVLTLSFASAHAGVKPGDGALFLNIGYSTGKSSVTGDNIDGGFIGLDYQKRDWANPVSGGFSIGYGKISQSITGVDSAVVDNTISSVPIFLGGKYWIGDGEKRFQGFVGAAFGMYFAQLETSVRSTVGVQNQDVSGTRTTRSTGFGAMTFSKTTY